MHSLRRASLEIRGEHHSDFLNFLVSFFQPILLYALVFTDSKPSSGTKYGTAVLKVFV